MRFTPLLAASLLLHMAVVGMIAGKLRQVQDTRSEPPMKVEYVEVVAHHGQIRRAHIPLPMPPAPVPRPAAPQERAATPRERNESVTVSSPGPASPLSAITATGGSAGTVITPLTFSGTGSVPVNRNNSGVGPENGTGTASGHNPGSAGQSTAAITAGDSTTLQNMRAAYQAQVKRIIEAHKEYPLAARRSRQEGNCLRRFVLNRGGTLVGEVERLSSCGHAFLDEAATRAITTVGIFPPPPDTSRNGEASITVTITFKLNTSREER